MASEEHLSCLVCHSSVTVYVVLPGCSQEHVYCEPCARKLLDPAHKPQARAKRLVAAKGIVCCLCSAFSAVPDLAKLRRFASRSWNPAHGRYCIDCAVGVGGGNPAEEASHRMHEVVTVADAVGTLRSELADHLSHLEACQQQVKARRVAVASKSEAISANEAALLRDWHAGVASLRTLLDEKERALSEAIAAVAEGKRQLVQTEMARLAAAQADLEDGAAECAFMVGQDDPHSFMRCQMNSRNLIGRAASVVVDKAEIDHVDSFPPLPLRFITSALASMRYLDQASGKGGGALATGGFTLMLNAPRASWRGGFCECRQLTILCLFAFASQRARLLAHRRERR